MVKVHKRAESGETVRDIDVLTPTGGRVRTIECRRFLLPLCRLFTPNAGVRRMLKLQRGLTNKRSGQVL